MKYLIGIDTGVHTGYAVWDAEDKAFMGIETLTISTALYRVKSISEIYRVKVFFEDARKRKWIPAMSSLRREMGRWQGSGSVMRDCKIWEDFCKENSIPYEAVAPKRNRTKLTAEAFRRLTGWKGRTSEHARDAAMLVFGK